VVEPGYHAAVADCGSHKVVKHVRGRHGHHAKTVVVASRGCGAHLTRASTAAPCAHGRKGHHAKCPSSRSTVADRRGHKHHGVRVAANWQVQVGAFQNRSGAEVHLARLERRYSERFGGLETAVDPSEGGLYRARFVGLSADDARDACAELKAEGQGCMARPLAD
jgi:hypothetical protein